MSPCNYQLYPSNWKTEIVPAIRKRARNRCEQCGIPHYCVVRWDKDRSEWDRCGGNLYLDDIGYEGAKTYQEAREIADHWNETGDWYEDGNRWIVIVLTTAHLDHDLTNNELSNLRLLCQRDHNRYDQQHRKETRQAKKGQLKLLL